MTPAGFLVALVVGSSLGGVGVCQGAQLPAQIASRPAAGCRIQPGAAAGAASRLFNGMRWTDGIVPFVYDPGVTPAMVAAMAAAMQEIGSRVLVRFVPRSTEIDYVYIRDSTINSSPIGRQGGVQVLHIANWSQRFEIVHALLHVLGFWHEHQRPDRDQFVAVQFANVDPSRATEFQLVPLGDTYGLPYDFDSVLHFGGTEGGIGGAQTIAVLPPNQAQQGAIGQRTHLSVGDVEALRRTYGSLQPPTITAITPNTVPSYHMPQVLVDGVLFDEVQRVLLRGSPINFVVLSPTQLRILPPQLPAIGAAQLVVESGAGASAPAILQITGMDPPVLEGPPVLYTTLSLPFKVYSDAVRTNLLLAAFDNVPSVSPGIVTLGIGNQFTTLGEVTRGVGDASGQWTVSLRGPGGLPSGISIWLQSVVFDPANFTLPLPASNVLPVRVF